MSFIRPLRFYFANAAGAPPPPPPPPPPPASAAFVTTRVLVSTTAATQTSGFVTPKFGVVFYPGDIPSGQVPEFKTAAGEHVPATIMSLSHHDDGSLRMCTAMLRWPQNIAGSTTVTAQVWSGGTLPTSAAVGITAATAANISHRFTGSRFLTGTWTASLNQGIADGDILLIGTGSAGSSYRVKQQFNNGTSDHAQMRAYFYVDVLQDSADGVAGIRFKTRPINGFADLSTDASSYTVSASHVLIGATTAINQTGYRVSGVTGTREIIYGTDIDFPFYSSFFGCKSNGDSFFVAGSKSDDCNIRITLDLSAKQYMQKTGFAMPWDLNNSPSATTATSYYPQGLQPLVDYDNDHTGDSVDVGLISSWQVKHFLSMSANDEQAAKVASLVVGSWRSCGRRAANEQLVPTCRSSAKYTGLSGEPTWWFSPSSNGSINFAAPASSTSCWLGDSTPSHRSEPHLYPYIMFGEQHSLDMLEENAYGIIAHTIPLGGLSPSILAGDQFSGPYVSTNNGNRFYQFSAAATRVYESVICPFGSNANRWPAWALRDVFHAWSVMPTTDPTGANKRGWISDTITETMEFTDAYTSSRGQGWSAGGFWDFGTDTTTGISNDMSWTDAYLIMSLAWGYRVMNNNSGVGKFMNHICRAFEYHANNGNFANSLGFYKMGRDSSGVRIESWATALASWGRGSITFSSATDKFTFTTGGSDSNFNFAPTNGDVVAFGHPFDSTKPYTVGNLVPQYVVSASSNKTCKLSDSPGGAPNNVTSDGSVVAIWARFQSTGSSYSAWGKTDLGGQDPGNINYLIPMALRYAKAVGGTEVSASLPIAERILVSAGNPASWISANPKWHLVSTIPS